MAHGTLTKMRLETGASAMKTVDVSERGKWLRRNLSSDGYTLGNVRLIELYYEATFSNGFAEIGAPNAVFDGSSVPAVVYVDSTSANDTVLGSGVRMVTIIGIDENDSIVAVVVETGGQTGQSSVIKFKRIFHAYPCAWGSNKDAEGDIYIQDDVSGTTKYLKIAAGTNESEGSAIFIPAGLEFTLNHIDFKMSSSANANAALLIKEGLINAGSGPDPDLGFHLWRTSINDAGVQGQDDDVHTAEDGCKMTISETYKGNAEDGWVEIHILIWS